MSAVILVLTLALLALPVVFVVAAATTTRVLLGPAAFVVLIYLWIWLRYRPTCFVVHPHTLEIVWPLKRRTIPLASITGARIIGRRELRPLVGIGLRIGAGGLWGGFGWLWTSRQGIVQMYISRIDRFVWIERAGGRPWLITPERPEELCARLTSQVA